MPVNGTFTARRGELGGAAVLFALGVAVAAMAWNMPLGSLREPGPGALPLALGALLAAASCGLLVRALRLHGDTAREPIHLLHARVGITLLVLLILAFLFERIGFLLSAGLLLAVLLRAYGVAGWPRCIAAAVVGAAVTWLVFSKGLGVNLPRGNWFA